MRQSRANGKNDVLFIMSLNFTERGIREIKDDLKRARAAQDLAKKCGCEIRQIFLTSGEYDLLQITETAKADNVAKYALANGSLTSPGLNERMDFGLIVQAKCEIARHQILYYWLYRRTYRGLHCLNPPSKRSS
jgi:uncharacterized protein with GYD domain